MVAEGIAQFFTELPFIFAGVVASLKQLGINFVNFFKTLAIDADIFANQVANSFGGGFEDYIKKRRADRAALQNEAKSAGAAFSEAYNQAKADADKLAREEEARLDEAARIKNAEAAAKISPIQYLIRAAVNTGDMNGAIKQYSKQCRLNNSHIKALKSITREELSALKRIQIKLAPLRNQLNSVKLIL